MKTLVLLVLKFLLLWYPYIIYTSICEVNFCNGALTLKLERLISFIPLMNNYLN